MDPPVGTYPTLVVPSYSLIVRVRAPVEALTSNGEPEEVPVAVAKETTPELVKVTAPVGPETEIPVPATAEVTPVLVIVTAPVAPDTEIPVPATFEATPVLVIVSISVAETTDVIPVPAVKVIVSPSEIVCVVAPSVISKVY